MLKVGSFGTVGAAGASAAAAGNFYMLHILTGLQYTYLAGRMNVASLPPYFKQVICRPSSHSLNERLICFTFDLWDGLDVCPDLLPGRNAGL